MTFCQADEPTQWFQDKTVFSVAVFITLKGFRWFLKCQCGGGQGNFPGPIFTTTHPCTWYKLHNGVTQTESPLTIELPRHHSPVWIFKGCMFRLRQFTTSHHCRFPLASWPLVGFLLLFLSLFLPVLLVLPWLRLKVSWSQKPSRV